MSLPDASPGARTLGVRALVYGIGHVLSKGLAFLTLPLFTRYLTREEYGAYALVLTAVQAMGLLLPLGLHGALAKFHFAAREDEERRRVAWTLWAGVAAVALLLAAALDLAGGLSGGSPFRELPFHPNLRLCVWTAFVGTLALVPLNLLQIRGRAGAFVLWTLAQSAASVGLSLLWVTALRRGVTGAQIGTLMGGAIVAVPLAAVALREARVCWRPDLLRSAFRYSLPLVPHGLLTWVLAGSDRLILERWVPLGEIGAYLLGWQLASVVGLLSSAMNSALAPHLFEIHAALGDGARPRVARIATYFALALFWAALGLALFAREAVLLLAGPDYRGAHGVVPWITGGMLLGGLYYIPANVLFLTSGTAGVLAATVASGAASVAMNLAFIPAGGASAAAVTSLASSGVLLLVAAVVAQRRWPIPYEAGRLARAAAVTAACWIAGGALAGRVPPVAESALKAALWLGWPFLLAATGFLRPEEWERLKRLLSAGSGKSGP